jgi:hypothetical protein
MSAKTNRKFVLPLVVLLISLWTLFGPCPAGAQNGASQPQPRYAVLEYLKRDPLKSPELRTLVREIVVPLEKERLRTGQIRSSSLWSVIYPGGTGGEYDMLSVTQFDKFADIENPRNTFNTVHPGLAASEFNVRINAARKVVRREVVEILGLARPGPQDARMQPAAPPAKYARIDYMKPEPSKGREYAESELKYYQPLWQEAVNQGLMRVWSVNAVRLPTGRTGNTDS